MLETKCYVEGCKKQPKYLIEWYGVNQHGKDPEVADERTVCDDFRHILQSSKHESYGGYPDGIVDFETFNFEQKSLLAKVIDAMKKSSDFHKA